MMLSNPSVRSACSRHARLPEQSRLCPEFHSGHTDRLYLRSFGMIHLFLWSSLIAGTRLSSAIVTPPIHITANHATLGFAYKFRQVSTTRLPDIDRARVVS